MEMQIASPVENLAHAWNTLKQEQPQLRMRDAAVQLGTSEAQLLATGIADRTVTRLTTDEWPTLLEAFSALGHVMCLTRNASCVLEHKGTFEHIEVIRAPHGAMATVLGPIELRVFFKHWTYAFAASLPGQNGKTLHSVQVFDRAGNAILKIFLQDDGNTAAYQDLVRRFRQPEQTAQLSTEPIPALHTEAINAIDREAFLTDWANLQDTHDYFGMLRKHKVAREDAMRLGLGQFTRRVDPAALEGLLTIVATPPRLPIMIFAGNTGNIQIHQDEVRHIKQMGPWLNVLDPNFNMHLRHDHISTLYEVHKPTSDGQVTSLEAFDAEGEMIVQFFGLRKPGIPEREDWRKLVADLPGIS